VKLIDRVCIFERMGKYLLSIRIAPVSAFMTIRDHLKRFMYSPVIAPTLNLHKPRQVSVPRTYTTFLDSPLFDRPSKYTQLCSFFTASQEIYVGDDVEIEYQQVESRRVGKQQKRVGIGRIMGSLLWIAKIAFIPSMQQR